MWGRRCGPERAGIFTFAITRSTNPNSGAKRVQELFGGRRKSDEIVASNVGAARAGAVWRARRVRQDAEVVVEGMVLLHQDDDVIHALQTTVRARR